MEEQKDLPKPLTDLPRDKEDLPLPEKELSAHTEYPKTNILKSKFFLLFIAISFLIAFLIGGFLLGKNNTEKPVACTLEAKICPDGTSVGRTGPKCEFETCPASTSADISNWKTYNNINAGFQIRYPEEIFTFLDNDSGGTFTELLDKTDKSTSNPSFPSRISFATETSELSKFKNNKQFDLNKIQADKTIRIIYENSGKQIYATCSLTGQNILEYCNQILSTFKFTDLADPKDFVESVFNSYIACDNNNFVDENGEINPNPNPVNCYAKYIDPNSTTTFASTKSSLCIGNGGPPDNGVSTDLINSTENSAKIILHYIFSGSGDISHEVDVVKENSNWKIDNMRCTLP